MIADDLTRALPELRAHAESLMLDFGRAEESVGKQYDDEAQENVETFEALFESRCKLQSRSLAAESSEVGGRTAVTVRHELHLPADTPPLEVGHVWEMTTVHPLSGAVVGARFRVVAPVGKTFATARRYEVTEVAS